MAIFRTKYMYPEKYRRKVIFLARSYYFLLSNSRTGAWLNNLLLEMLKKLLIFAPQQHEFVLKLTEHKLYITTEIEKHVNKSAPGSKNTKWYPVYTETILSGCSLHYITIAVLNEFIKEKEYQYNLVNHFRKVL